MNNGPWSAGGAGDLRASDADRDRTADVLREAAAEGRLDLSELEERLERTFNAKTYAELEPVTADLPAAKSGHGAGRASVRRQDPASATAVQPGPNEVTAVLGEQKITGHWLVPRRLTARALLGQVTLDFTEAALPHEVDLDVVVGLGQLTLIVPDDIAVEFDHATAILAERKNRTRGVRAPGTPVIRVRGTVVLGEIDARPPRRRWFKR